MLTTLSTREVETSNTMETGSFSIKANGKAFKVLIDGLYSDKARAVVRELWSNAFDSHIEAGRADQPFDCHLPTVWEPWFTVRDYGVSMTHVGVMRLYTTVFESSKEDTNAQVGKLGLGSKSPFAYTDTFTVTAYLKGERRTYSAFIGADYIPRISHMDTAQTTEPDGLEVSFPVKIEDIANFTIAAQRTALGFDVLPNIIGSDQLSAGKRVVVLEGTGWRLYDRLGDTSSAHAKQGCVVYPMSPGAIPGLSTAHYDIMNSPFLIDFPIGDLEIAASREGLGYDDTTIANIKTRLAAIESELVLAVEKELASIGTVHELMLWMQRTAGDYNTPKALKSILSKAKWRGRVPAAYASIKTKQLQGAVLTFSAHVLRRYVNIAKQAGSASHVTYTPGNEGPVVCFRDTSVNVPGALTRAHLYMKTHRANRGMFYVSANLKTHPNAFKRLLVAMGRPDPSIVVLVNALPAPPKNAAGVKAPVKVRVFGHRDDVRDWLQVDVDANGGGVYIDIERFDIKSGDKEMSYGSTKLIIGALRDAGLIEGDVYAIPRTLAKKFLKEENGWTNLFDLAQAQLDANFDAQIAAERQAMRRYVTNEWRIDTMPGVVKMLSEHPAAKTINDGPFKAAMAPYIALHDALASDVEHDHWLQIAGALNVQLPAPKTVEPSVPTSKLLGRYPMLDLICDVARLSPGEEKQNKIVLDYINLIDSQ